LLLFLQSHPNQIEGVRELVALLELGAADDNAAAAAVCEEVAAVPTEAGLDLDVSTGFKLGVYLLQDSLPGGNCHAYIPPSLLASTATYTSCIKHSRDTVECSEKDLKRT
jgi:hypothetical protein